MVSRHSEKAGGLEGTEPGVEWRVGRWEMQAGAKPCRAWCGFYSKCLEQRKRSSFLAIFCPVKAPRPADHNDGLMEVRTGRDSSGQRGLWWPHLNDLSLISLTQGLWALGSTQL